MPDDTRNTEAQPITVFVSYSHQDEALRQELDVHLSNLRRQGKISAWNDREIGAGTEWDAEIKAQLEAADVILLLISPDFIASDYCYDLEMQRAMHRHEAGTARVIPIVLRPVDWKGTPFSKLATLPKDAKPITTWDNRDEAFLNVVQEIRQVVELLRPNPDYSAPDVHLWNVPKEPPHYLPRPEELEELRKKLLGDQSVVMTAAAVVQGMGGLGKSVLAAAIAQDPTVQQAFPDGIFWLTIGQEGKLLELQTSLAKALSGRQPEFTTVQEGMRELRSLLSKKACLLVLDDIWREVDLAALNVVGARGQLLVTTRDARMATSIGATVHQLDVLARSQARQLLAEWTNLEEANLPTVADEVVRECGALPLALAMVGAMLRRAPDRWENVLHKLRSTDLEKIRQQFPDYPYPDLLKALQVSVDALEPELRDRYLEFAVFPEDVPIPERVLQVWWGAKGLDEHEAQDAIDALKDLSLLRKDEQGRITLHDLQMDFVRKQMGQGVGRLHQDWIAAYRSKCREGWHGLMDDGYGFAGVPYHLQQAGELQELRGLLLDFRWLQAKLWATTINEVLRDYELVPEEQTLKLVRNSLRLSAHVLADEKEQLAGQLWGRLCGREQPEIRELLEEAERSQSGVWLRSLKANLTPPDGALLRTLEGHRDSVNSVAVLPDGKRALSASVDATLKLWDLNTGEVIANLTGDSSFYCCAVAPDGVTIVAGDSAGRVHFFRLEQ